MLTSIPRVQVTKFFKPMRTGANKPWLTSCKDTSGNRYEYVIKFHNVLNRSIIREFASAYLAACLDIQSPPFAVVEVPNTLEKIVPDPSLKELIAGSNGLHWGTQYLTGFTEFTIDTFIADGMIENMIQLFAFDMLIQNQDRTSDGKQHGNPNLLIKGDVFVAIDHDKTFICTDPLARMFSKKPWELRGENATNRHIFRAQIRKYAEKHTLTFEPFIEKFKTLPPAVLTTMFESMPMTWRDDEYERLILEHLISIQSNLSKFSNSLMEVFA